MPDSLSGWKPRKVSICQITILEKLNKKMTFSKIFDISLAWKLQYWISFLIQSPNCSQTFSSWWEGAATDVCKIFAHCKNSIICCCLFLEHCIIGVFTSIGAQSLLNPPVQLQKCIKIFYYKPLLQRSWGWICRDWRCWGCWWRLRGSWRRGCWTRSSRRRTGAPAWCG